MNIWTAWTLAGGRQIVNFFYRLIFDILITKFLLQINLFLHFSPILNRKCQNLCIQVFFWFGKKFKEGARFPKHQDFLLSMEILMIPLKAGRTWCFGSNLPLIMMSRHGHKGIWSWRTKQLSRELISNFQHNLYKGTN